MKKIAIIGSPGAGKSTFSKKLSEILSIEVYHIDKLFWKPGWVQITKAELQEKFLEIFKLDTWIIDGNYLDTMDMRIHEADTIIFLDYPLWLCLWGVVQRRLLYSRKIRPDITEGCKEKLNLEFLIFVVNFSRKQKKLVYEKLEKLPVEKNLYIFKNRSELNRFLQNINFCK